ncbi:acyl-CoA dehydrogenase family protein [Nocardiopsis quinghaiensis]|uniref:acyl-CoA dehydrogenase family protein n=1 Tax=Nocardiopsis quinghaiensis TaxID=464995 RepID=UPI0012389BCA|nr:acyl-CoA dehydrogenase family protein [Nocardiopsis quinghaiensis]
MTVSEEKKSPDATEPSVFVERARDIAASLVERQAETEARSYYAPDTHEALREAGLYRLLVPRRHGGHEVGVDTFFEVVLTLTRACPSTGWMYCLGAAHALPAATLFGERAQAEMFGGGDFICPNTVAPSGVADRLPDGSWRVSGTWKYCSGSPYATHFMGHALMSGPEGGDPVTVLFVAPRESWERLDDWGDQLGLRGSGSHSVRMEGAVLPGHLVLETHLSQGRISTDTPGHLIHDHPQYGGGPLSFMLLESAVLAVGMAQAALDAFESLMRERNTSFPPIVPRYEDPDYQHWYGEAAGMIATAEAALADTVSRWLGTCERGPDAFTKEFEWGVATVCREVARLSWQAVQSHLFPKAGSSAVRRGERVERVWRDMSTMRSHAGFSVVLESMANRELARARFHIGEESSEEL